MSSEPPSNNNAQGNDQGGKNDVDRRVRHILTVTAMTLLIMVLTYMILSELKSILQPLMVAIFLGYLIIPAHRWLVRHKLPSLLSYVVIVGTVLSVMFVIGNVAFLGVSEMSREIPAYLVKFEDTAGNWLQKFDEKIDSFTETQMRFQAEPSTQPSTQPGGWFELTTLPATQPTTSPAWYTYVPPGNSLPETPIERTSLLNAQRLMSLLQSTVETFVGIFTVIFVVVIYLMFLLAEAVSFRQRLFNAFGQQRAEQAVEVIDKINAAITRYIAVKTFVSILIGVFSAFVLMLFGVKYALVWGLLTFFANFIPYIGSLVAVSLPIALSFAIFANPWVPVLIAFILITAQVLVGNFLEPMIIGQRLGVSPLVILLSLAFWGMLWGVPGMILSAPLAVTMKIVLENFEPTRPIARLCSHR